jgi:hypothetical protein
LARARIERVLTLYASRPEALFSDLERKYGPEPRIASKSKQRALRGSDASETVPGALSSPTLSLAAVQGIREACANLAFNLLGRFHVHEAVDAKRGGDKAVAAMLARRGIPVENHAFIARVLRTHMAAAFMDEHFGRARARPGVQGGPAEADATLFDAYVDRRLIDGATRRAASAMLFSEPRRATLGRDTACPALASMTVDLTAAR